MARYQWKVIAWGSQPHERIKGEPTEKELETAHVVVVQYTNIRDSKDVQYFTIRAPGGFGGFAVGGRHRDALEDLAAQIDLQAERYNWEIAH